MLQQYVYTGPSWAGSSYPVTDNSTNLAREWKIPCIDMAQKGSGVLPLSQCIKKLNSKLYFILKYTGRIGTYDENSSVDLWISPQFIK